MLGTSSRPSTLTPMEIASKDTKESTPPTIGIVGLGYVGLPLAIQFSKSGLKVVGIDVDAAKIDSLNAGKSYIGHIDGSLIDELRLGGRFLATTDFADASECDALILCVPTPLNQHREPDLSFVLETGASLSPHLKRGALVCLESTTYPGTTEIDLRKVLESGSGKTAGVDFHLAYSPEREDPSNPESQVERIPKLVGGLTLACRDKAVSIYAHAIQTIVPVESCKVAEAAKLLENIFRSVNIALVNELKVIYGKMGIDIWEVIEAAKTKPFGFMPFYPGPGLGGHCIPIDPFYLSWKAREFGVETRFIELAGEINTTMPDYVVEKVGEALKQAAKAITGARILVLGLAYKPNVDDDRESPSYVLIEKLEKLGAEVSYNDPKIPEIKPTREHAHLAGRKSVEITDRFDLILLATHHQEYSEVDFSGFQCPIVDTRNCLQRPPAQYFKA
jgi:UDP-N-acetyl-D-glucosamine dehydrogenase